MDFKNLEKGTSFTPVREEDNHLYNTADTKFPGFQPGESDMRGALNLFVNLKEGHREAAHQYPLFAFSIYLKFAIEQSK